MRKLSASFLILLFVISCTKNGEWGGRIDGSSSDVGAGLSSSSGSSGGSGSGSGSGTGSGSNNPGDSSGLMTAGEWNDLGHWNFWNELMQRDTIKTYSGVWGFYNQNKITVILRDVKNQLVHDAKINLVYNGSSVSAKTSNDGKAELYPSLYQAGFILENFTVSAEYFGQTFDLGSYSSSQTLITKNIPIAKSVNHTLDIMFVVDATGSMADEIFYLKNELKDVINRAGSQLAGMQLRMGSVFYRDFGDDYVTRAFDFTTNANQLNDFVNNQNAYDGGDYPEAVDEALKAAIQDQQWSASAVNRLLFLVLDAPPHNTPDVMTQLKTAVTEAQKKGIRIIPVSASGIDWETEFLLRFLSVSTNSTYVFITDHSGIGNPHHSPTVGTYQVEYLNNLMVRLITQYGQNKD